VRDFLLYLYDPCLLEGRVCAVLLDGLDRAGRESEDESLVELRNEDALLLEIHLLSHFAGRVELRRTGAVRVSSSYERGPFCDWADFCHRNSAQKYCFERVRSILSRLFIRRNPSQAAK